MLQKLRFVFKMWRQRSRRGGPRNRNFATDETVESLDTIRARHRVAYEFARSCGGSAGERLVERLEKFVRCEEASAEQQARLREELELQPLHPLGSTLKLWEMKPQEVPKVKPSEPDSRKSRPIAVSFKWRSYSLRREVSSRSTKTRVPHKINIPTNHAMSCKLLNGDPSNLNADDVLWTANTILSHESLPDDWTQSLLRGMTQELEEAIEAEDLDFVEPASRKLIEELQDVVHSNESLKALFEHETQGMAENRTWFRKLSRFFHRN